MCLFDVQYRVNERGSSFENAFWSYLLRSAVILTRITPFINPIMNTKQTQTPRIGHRITTLIPVAFEQHQYHYFSILIISSFASQPTFISTLIKLIALQISSQMGVNVQGPSMPHNRGILSIMTTLLAITTTIPFTQGQNCLLPETFNPYFQAALDDVESTFTNDVVGGLSDIGLGPIAQLSINDLIDFKQSIFEPLFGNPVQRNEWINVTSVLNVKAQLESKLDDIIGSIPPGLSMTCELETTDDLEEEELPYRFGMEFVLTGSLLGDDLDLTLLSPKIAVLPEDSFNPLELTVQALSIDYALTLPLTIDTKRRKFMIGEITISLEGSLNTDVLQSISLTETVSQDFQGSLALDMTLSYSSVSDWAYTASFESSLTAETSVGTAVANLGLVAMDDDLFDDKPRESSFKVICCCPYIQGYSRF